MKEAHDDLGRWAADRKMNTAKYHNTLERLAEKLVKCSFQPKSHCAIKDRKIGRSSCKYIVTQAPDEERIEKDQIPVHRSRPCDSLEQGRRVILVSNYRYGTIHCTGIHNFETVRSFYDTLIGKSTLRFPLPVSVSHYLNPNAHHNLFSFFERVPADMIVLWCSGKHTYNRIL